MIDSAYPVASLIAAHLHGSPSLDEAVQRLRHQQGELARVWRQGVWPRLHHIEPAA